MQALWSWNLELLVHSPDFFPPEDWIFIIFIKSQTFLYGSCWAAKIW